MVDFFKKKAVRVRESLGNIFSPIFTYAAEAGQGKEALPFITTLAAIMYVISSSLGSGSYKEIHYFFGSVSEVVMVVILFSATVIFSVSLMSYIDNILNLSKFLRSKKNISLLFPDSLLGPILILSILVITSAFAYDFFSTQLTDKEVNFLTGISLFSVFFFMSFFVLHILEDIIRSKDGVYLTSIIITVCSMAICANVYRDSYKESFNANSQYCYWISDYLEETNNEDDILSRPPDERLCQGLLDNHVNFRFLKFSPFVTSE